MSMTLAEMKQEAIDRLALDGDWKRDVQLAYMSGMSAVVRHELEDAGKDHASKALQADTWLDVATELKQYTMRFEVLMPESARETEEFAILQRLVVLGSVCLRRVIHKHVLRLLEGSGQV